MSKVDWSLAPEGATHKETSCPNGFWYKFDFHNNQACFWSGKGWTNPISADAYNDGSMDTMEPRPAKPWSGPEDGLPPVGSVVEYGGEQVRVIAHTDNNGHPAAVSQRGETGHIIIALPKYYQPARTPEQKAESARETAIRDVMDIAQVDCRVTAARLVDAGFKR